MEQHSSNTEQMKLGQSIWVLKYIDLSELTYKRSFMDSITALEITEQSAQSKLWDQLIAEYF